MHNGGLPAGFRVHSEKRHELSSLSFLGVWISTRALHSLNVECRSVFQLGYGPVRTSHVLDAGRWWRYNGLDGHVFEPSHTATLHQLAKFEQRQLVSLGLMLVEVIVTDFSLR